LDSFNSSDFSCLLFGIKVQSVNIMAINFLTYMGKIEGTVKYTGPTPCHRMLTPVCLGGIAEKDILTHDEYQRFFEVSAKICALYPCNPSTCHGTEIWVSHHCISLRSCLRTTWIQQFGWDHYTNQQHQWRLSDRGNIPSTDDDKSLQELAKEFPIIARPSSMLDVIKKKYPIYCQKYNFIAS
jgi:hypothetical protein